MEINYTHQNWKCMLSEDKNERVNHIKSKNELQDEVRFDRMYHPLRIVQKNTILPLNQMVYAETRIRSKKWVV